MLPRNEIAGLNYVSSLACSWGHHFEKIKRRQREPVSRVLSASQNPGLVGWSFLWATGYPVALAA